MKNFFKKITGIEKVEKAKEEARKIIDEAYEIKAEAVDAMKQAQAAIETANLAKLSAKEIATRNGEPWVDVIDSQMNPETMLYDYAVLDWNDLFIQKLKELGYGSEGDADEDVVDRWYRRLVHVVAAEQNIDMQDRAVGMLTISNKKIDNDRSEVS